VWTNHYNQPPTSTLGGLPMTQTTDHVFVEWANPTKNSTKWSCSGRQWWVRNFLPKMFLGMVENSPIHLIFKPLGVDFPNGQYRHYA